MDSWPKKAGRSSDSSLMARRKSAAISKPLKIKVVSPSKKLKRTKKMSLIKHKNILIGCTGSVASIKLPNLISELKSKDPTYNVSL